MSPNGTDSGKRPPARGADEPSHTVTRSANGSLANDHGRRAMQWLADVVGDLDAALTMLADRVPEKEAVRLRRVVERCRMLMERDLELVLDTIAAVVTRKHRDPLVSRVHLLNMVFSEIDRIQRGQKDPDRLGGPYAKAASNRDLDLEAAIQRSIDDLVSESASLAALKTLVDETTKKLKTYKPDLRHAIHYWLDSPDLKGPGPTELQRETGLTDHYARVLIPRFLGALEGPLRDALTRLQHVINMPQVDKPEEAVLRIAWKTWGPVPGPPRL